MQQFNLSISASQWSTRPTNGSFSVSFFWPSSIRGGTSQKKPRKFRKIKRRSTVLPSATVAPDTHPAPAKQASGAQTSRVHTPHTPTNANPSAHCRSLSPSRLRAATLPLAETQGSNCSETSSPVQDKPTRGSQDSGWTLVTPRRRKRGQGPNVPPSECLFTFGHLEYSKSIHDCTNPSYVVSCNKHYCFHIIADFDMPM